MTDVIQLSLTVNDQDQSLDVSSSDSLMTILREQLRLTGTKCGCNVGTCGTCAVILNGKAVRSCTIKPDKLQSARVETIEGLADGDKLHPLQQAFVDRQGTQCGFCAPGMIMSAKALLDEHSDPTDQQIKHALRVSLCRCTGYDQAIEAIREAAGQLQPGESTGRLVIEGPATTTTWVGRSVPRKGADDLVTGRAQYTDDIEGPERMLYLVTKRSERAHADIVSIDCRAAEGMAGVVRVLTAKDIPGENRYGKIIRDIPVLAEERVRSYSDAVALVIADSYRIAREAAGLIKVVYKDREPLFDPEQALDPDAPQIHPTGNLLYEFDII